jgi:hypothetical protein
MGAKISDYTLLDWQSSYRVAGRGRTAECPTGNLE